MSELENKIKQIEKYLPFNGGTKCKSCKKYKNILNNCNGCNIELCDVCSDSHHIECFINRCVDCLKKKDKMSICDECKNNVCEQCKNTHFEECTVHNCKKYRIKRCKNQMRYTYGHMINGLTGPRRRCCKECIYEK